MEKTCTACGRLLPLTMFYNNPCGLYGKHSRCCDCHKKAQREREGSEARRNAYKKYRQTDKGKIAARKARNNFRGSENGRLADRRYYRKRHWYALCKAAVNNAVQSGALPKAASVPCSSFSDDCHGIHHWHHDSYKREDWLNVRCFCQYHHREWHRTNQYIACEEADSLSPVPLEARDAHPIG